jgi:hypothetical protein
MSYIDENFFLFRNDPKNDKIQMILVAIKKFFGTNGSGSVFGFKKCGTAEL